MENDKDKARQDEAVVQLAQRGLSAYGADKRRWPPGLRRQLDAMLAKGDAPARALAQQLREEAQLDGALAGLQMTQSEADAERHIAKLLADFDALPARAAAHADAPASSWRLGAMLAAGFALGMWSGFWIVEYMPLPGGGPAYVTALLETAIGDGITRFFP